MSTRTTAARRSVVTGLLALTVLGGTAASGVGVTAAVAAPASSSSSSQVATTTKTTDFGYLTKIVRTSSGRRLVLDRAIMHVGAEAFAQRARRGLERPTTTSRTTTRSCAPSGSGRASSSTAPST